MKTPVVLVTVALTLAILLAATLLIATGTRGENAPAPHGVVTRQKVAHSISFEPTSRRAARVRSTAP
jgi:hypothetical protein